MEREFIWTLEIYNGDILSVACRYCSQLDGPADNYILFTVDELHALRALHDSMPKILLNPDWSIACQQVIDRADHVRNTIISKRTL